MIKKSYFLSGIFSVMALLPFSSKAQTLSAETLSHMALDAHSGEWFALHHTSGLRSDVCMASHANGDLLLRSGFEAGMPLLEIRSTNKDWNLTPLKTKGELTISVGKFNKKFTMLAVMQKVLTALITPEDMKDLLDALEKEKQATLLFGSKTKMTISLSGSSKVLNSFRACTIGAGVADISGNTNHDVSPF